MSPPERWSWMGARTPLSLAPRQSRTLALEIALPPEPGEYNVYVSAMREHVAWFYDQGWPFLLIDISVDDNGAPRLGSAGASPTSARSPAGACSAARPGFQLCRCNPSGGIAI